MNISNNSAGNDSSCQTNNYYPLQTFVACSNLNLYFPIFIAIVGVTGNVIAFLTIVLSELRKNYVNKYLLVLLVSDSVLLLTIVMQRIFNFRNINFGVCLIAQYFWNTPIWISNLAILLLTLERCFAIFFPLDHFQYSNFGRWQLLFIIISLAMAANLNLFAVLHPEPDDIRPNMGTQKCWYVYERSRCPYAKQLFLIPRIVFTFLLPFFSVILVNIAIFVKLRGRALIQGRNVSTEARNNNKVLFVIPVVYVLLNLPYNVQLFTGYLTDIAKVLKQPYFDRLFLFIFFTNYAINCALYAMASRTFRQTALRLWIYPLLGREPGERESAENSKETAGSKETEETNV